MSANLVITAVAPSFAPARFKSLQGVNNTKQQRSAAVPSTEVCHYGLYTHATAYHHS